MKKTLFLALMLIFSASIFAQTEVTKFLGIPVDGTKSEMIRKLKAKGFEEHPYYDKCLTGEFNGKNVNVYVITNNNKVYRIAVIETSDLDEGQIKIRYNNLVRQFENNRKYIPGAESATEYIIPEDENISYNISVKNKQYQAAFYQMTDEEQASSYTLDTFYRRVWFTISKSIRDYCICIYYENLLNEANGEDL